MPVPAVPQTLVGVVPPQLIHTAPRQVAEPATAEPAIAAAAKPDPSVVQIDAARLRRRARIATAIGVAGVLAAASAILYVTQRAPTVVAVAPAKSPAEARAELLATAKDVTTLAWTPTQDPNGANATGDVVWSATAQQGYMRFAGLAPNDPTQIQYQLWIFDKNRPEATPVDGGVFDVSSTGEVIVPITAKLTVGEPVLFAVTIEKPGGVVVSKRERIVVTAAPATRG
jgi:anti-sigma-K factor RskA